VETGRRFELIEIKAGSLGASGVGEKSEQSEGEGLDAHGEWSHIVVDAGAVKLVEGLPAQKYRGTQFLYQFPPKLPWRGQAVAGGSAIMLLKTKKLFYWIRVQGFGTQTVNREAGRFMAYSL
jgi:hypothetical protein